MMMQSWERYCLSRRGLLAGAISLGALRAMPADPGCTLTAEQEEGPYYIASQNIRRSLTEDRPGAPLKLRVALVDAKSCGPLSNAAVDIWHCDASGMYSGFAAAAEGGPGMQGRGGRGGPNGMPPPPPDGGPEGFGRGPGGQPPSRITDATRFLRGVQISASNGIVEFETLYPGWYPGRAIHIHMKVHLGGDLAAEKYAGGHVSHTGQFFFPEEITAQLARVPP
jgi:protocatechuate 3,4-dioxygenase beta subunit